MSSAAILATHNLTVGYTSGKRRVPLLSGLNLTLEPGQVVALLGQNGAGKSTLLRALTCYSPPLAGVLEIAGRDAATLSRKQLSRLVGLVTTEHVQAGALTVRELVALGRQPHTGFLGRQSAADRQVVERAMQLVGIASHSGSYVAGLSDGERQKAMIARALAQETPLIVLDEPSAFLDAASRIEMMQLLAQLARDERKAILLSTHDISRSLMLTSHLWLITRDRQLLAGPTAQMVHSAAMNQVFSSPHVVFNSEHCDYQAVDSRPVATRGRDVF